MFKQCQSCGIRQLGGQFYWFRKYPPSEVSSEPEVKHIPATPQEVAAKVCQYARDRAKPCINSCTEFREADGWQPPPSWAELENTINYPQAETPLN